MIYRDFGSTGVKISALGFGAMRLPEVVRGEEYYVDEDKAIPLIHRAFELGVNYIDSAHGYCHGKSEIAVGKALKGWRDRVFVSTKCPTWAVKSTDGYRKSLEEQLGKLDTDYIDFYHFHGLGKGPWEDVVQKYDLIKEAQRAKEEGLIRHISFSFHDDPDVLKMFADTGVFETVLCQYNLLDRANEEAIAYVRSKGMGVVVMGPVGGGRLQYPSEILAEMIKENQMSTPEMALRFVLANQNVSCALSGMSTIEMVEQNAAVASDLRTLSPDELDQVKTATVNFKKLADLYCTGCNYCMPCPNDVNIPQNFTAMNYLRVYGLSELAKNHYDSIRTDGWPKGKKAEDCVECGVCEEKCPQKINIRQQLRETAKALGR